MKKATDENTTQQPQTDIPPVPQAGGSYVHDEATGTLTLVHRTQERGGRTADPADQAPPQE